MKTTRILFGGCLAVGVLLLFCACGKKTPGAAPELFNDQLAVISRCDVPIISIDGQSFSVPLHKTSLEPGYHVLVVEYPTTLALYHCTFEVVFEAGQMYEIIDRFDRYPVFLNRIKKHMLVTTRLEKFPPRECNKIEKQDDS